MQGFKHDGMVSAFVQFIHKNELISNRPILISVSGGRDSVALCELYHQAKIPFFMAHCNFGLRGDESDGDEAFVLELAKRYDVQLFVKRFETAQYAKESGISIQMAARELRVAWLRQLVEQNGLDYFATAHHLDDHIETYFLHIMRGTGISGLHGILPKNGSLIHPLLYASRQNIDSFIELYSLNWRDDSSNSTTKYIRNKIRHQLLPLMEQINPDIKQIIAGNMDRITAIEHIFNDKIDEYRKLLVVEELAEIRINNDLLSQLNQAPTILYELVKEFGFNFTQVSQILESSVKQNSGVSVYSTTHELFRDRSYLILKQFQGISSDLESVLISEETLHISSPIQMEFENSSNYIASATEFVAQLDFEKLTFPLSLRKWKQGDVFYPIGMKGRKKKLSDFFIDIKLNKFEKEQVWVLTENEKIVWIVGYRLDERYKITRRTNIIFKATRLKNSHI
jgi:tRNA(Ile)-lysidine synthase